MAVTSGFFNSKNHDRLYDATQFSSFFDGLITDGVYQSIGDAFMVSAYADGNSAVLVGTGRAWFNRTWLVNDALLMLSLDPPSTLLDRIDAIVLDIDRSEAVRANTIKVVKGEYSETAARPTLIHTDTHDQYPLAYVTVPHGDDAPVAPMNIANMVGTSECPLVAGFLESMDITMFISQMEDKFYNWFEDLQTNLSGDVAANLQNQINQLEEDVEEASQGAINFDTLEKAKNVSVTVSTISKPNNGGSGSPLHHWYYLDMLLPDGYAIDTVLNNVQTGGRCDLAARLLSPDGVKISEVTLKSGTFYNESGLSVIYASETYPYTLVLASYETTSITPNTGYDPSGTVTIKCSIYTISVTATHVMTSTYSEKSLKASNIDTNGGGTGHDPEPESMLSLRPGILNDGSYVLCASVGDTSGEGVCTIVYRITSNFLVDKILDVTESVVFGDINYSRWSPTPHYIFTSDATDVNKRIVAAGRDTHTVQKSILIDPSTGKIVSTSGSVYESDLVSIPVDGSSKIVSNATTIGVYDHKTVPTSTIPIPLSTELSWSLDGSDSFTSWKSGVMDTEERLLLIGNGSQIRAGIIPEKGLMIWSSPVSGGVFTSSSETMFSLLFVPKASWTTNEDGSIHYILIRGGVALSLSAGNICPILPTVNWDTSTSKIVKVDLGEW